MDTGRIPGGDGRDDLAEVEYEVLVEDLRIENPAGEELIEAAENMLRVLDNVATHAPADGYEFGGFGEHKAMRRLSRAVRQARAE